MCNVVYAYLGDLINSCKGRGTEKGKTWRNSNDLSEVGLSHSSVEDCESSWSEGDSK